MAYDTEMTCLVRIQNHMYICLFNRSDKKNLLNKWRVERTGIGQAVGASHGFFGQSSKSWMYWDPMLNTSTKIYFLTTFI